MTEVKGGSAADRKFSGACSWRANDGERSRAGERMSTGFVESTVNQVISKRFCKQQQMDAARCPSATADPDAGLEW